MERLLGPPMDPPEPRRDETQSGRRKRPGRKGVACSHITFSWFVTTLLLVLPTCLGQNEANLDPASVISPGVESRVQSEGFFVNGSSYAVISETLRIERGSHVGFSFRTCASGELLRQTGTGSSLDVIQMVLNREGKIVLTITVGERKIEEVLGEGLNDGQWHMVVLRVSDGEDQTDNLTLSVSHGATSSSKAIPLNGMIRDLNLTTGTSQIRVGGGLIACFREGPGVRFTKPNVAVNSGAVLWGNCLLPETCEGYDWGSIVDSPAVSCDSTLCANNGVCLPLRSPQTDGGVCLCPAGYTDAKCEVLISTCSENPCKNGAPCNEDPSGGTGYNCDCSGTGYEGRHCEIESPHCDQNSCMNGGTCLNQPTGIICECGPQFTGLRCENNIRVAKTNPCLVDNPCLNEGTCMYSESSLNHVCNCPARFSGNNCEVDLCEAMNCPQNSECVGGNECNCLPGFKMTNSSGISTCEDLDECSDNPCKNGAACINLQNEFRCQCTNGFNGTTCDELVDYCAVNNRCLNGASCRNMPETASISCDCSVGFSGLFCQDDINECLTTPPPCQNNGQCQNLKGSYSCQCEPGFSGTHCETNNDECQSSPCLNNGTCRDLINEFQCLCSPGFDGPTCANNIDECASQPCLNGGSCLDHVNEFTCNCSPQFMGTTCNETYNPCVENSCENGGSCNIKKNERDPGNDFSCNCPPGFNGIRCETNINECEGVTCNNNMICVDLIATYKCECPQGFEGENCSVEIDECLPNPCANGATCKDRTGGFDCQCAIGWNGTTCSDDIDECAGNAKLCNNGICRNTAGSYECYCRPGFSGNHCNHDFDECLSVPCQNGGSCSNLVNSYECTCAPGFEGLNCEVDIDECESSPCLNGATCVDGTNNFTCTCEPGYTGWLCETDIDECESNPCLHNGTCEDSINAYTCNCEGTGYEGSNCDIDIDECAVVPCQNNATCKDLINDYECECFEGFGGKNCDQDISECLENPCENGGVCYELSNMTLYSPEVLSELPSDVYPHFNRVFSYFYAAGYVCSCRSGFKGVNCEININECEPQPCKHGTCQDGINEYTCNCEPGYEGSQCEREINECELYDPCVQGICIDRLADYDCQCNPNFGGKNCSVALIGCDNVNCLNGGTCTPWLAGEDIHRANCTCTAGFDGLRCQSRTTFSLTGKSYIKVPSDRNEGYELHMRFRTTIGNGLVAIGQGNTHYSLQLKNGKLNLHSNLINKYEGILIGENLNNTKWQKVYVAVNASYLTLGVNDRFQLTQPINPSGDNDTVYFNTFIGGIVRDQEILANNAPSFIGCIQDIVVNDMKITEVDIKENRGVEQVNTEPGCPRKDQCHPNPCQNDGACTDLWNVYQCTCNRPFLGSSCQYNYTAATFGYENVTHSIALVDIDDPVPYRLGVDISMFIRTREEEGFIFYIGSDVHHPTVSYITGQLYKGNLLVSVNFEGKQERFQVYTLNLSDGNRHFIRVVRMNNSMMVKVNETVSINHEIPSPTGFNADKLYLGNFPGGETPPVTQSRTPPQSSTIASPVSQAVDQITTLMPDAIVDEESFDTTLPSGLLYLNAAETSTFSSSSVDGDVTQLNEVIPSGEGQVESTTDLEEVEQVSASPILVSRAKREQNIGQSDFGYTDLQNFKPPHFKGVIQDIQISNGGNVTRIVELFKFNFSDVVVKPDSIGQVNLYEVKQGVVSDNACRENPCANSGVCHITWNDYSCECPEGYRGRNCTEKEYCYWHTCPEGSDCVSLIDGHECITNATFNGLNSTVILRPNHEGNLISTTISATFRTQRNGTLLHIVGPNEKFIRVAVQESKVVVEFPEHEGTGSTSFGRRANDGKWHTIVIRFLKEVLTAHIDGSQEEQLSLDLSLDLDQFVRGGEIVVGASHGHPLGAREEYQFGEESDDSFDIHTAGSYSDHFRGCIGEMRIGGVLVPFHSDLELVNATASNRFIVESKQDVSTGGCVLCFNQECLNGGSCQNPSEVYQCQCPEGFEDAYCETNIDECIGSRCNNGYCVDGVANYTCKCLTGWTGWLCDEDYDECLSSPCQNGGYCQQTEDPGNYTCACTDEFIGHDCQELKIKTCNEFPCKNGGTCRPGQNPESDDLYTCDCTTAFRGVDCELKKDFCEEFQFPCQNGATCISMESTFYYKCVCPPGYTGDNCENEIDECQPNPCNTGRCTDLLDDFKCDCAGTGFEGLNCETNIDECLAKPCQQGTCSDLPGSYHCECLEGYCGTNCQREDPCQLNEGLCKNDGVCQPSCDETPFYQCACSNEWEGHNCTIKVDKVGGYIDLGTQDLAMIIGPTAVGIVLIILVMLICLVSIARKKRSLHGTYNPQKQEYNAPRMELAPLTKIPPVERLI